MKRLFHCFVAIGLVIAFCIVCSSLSEAKEKRSHILRSGKILFAAHGSTDGSAPLQLFVADAKGRDLTQISGWLVTGGENYGTPDIAKTAGGGWRIAWGVNGIKVWDSATGETIGIDRLGATRADFNSDGTWLVYQAGGIGINIWKSAWDGSSASQITNVTQSPQGEWYNAEWPYFIPKSEKVFYFATYGEYNRHVAELDGSDEKEIPSPGGNTVSHAGMKSDGTEFVNPDNLTSYFFSTGEVGTINDLKNTTTLMNQLSMLGLEEVPLSIASGQGGNGTFALSVDWSEDGEKLVFDALVKDRASGLYGVAIFTFDLIENKLWLVYGPEPLEPSRTRNYNYSIHTPKWIP